jgi:hypothetical protein
MPPLTFRANQLSSQVRASIAQQHVKKSEQIYNRENAKRTRARLGFDDVHQNPSRNRSWEAR